MLEAEMRIRFANALIVDGTGSPPQMGELLVEGDRIAEVGSSSLSSDECLDLRGAVLCPAFIDMHSHDDFVLSVEADNFPKTRQGVGTVVVANCGLSAYPANEKVRSFYERFSPVIFGESGGSDGIFETLSSFRKGLEGKGIATNVVPLVGHGNIRAMVMGLEQRAPSPPERRAMAELVAQAHEEGAFGLSTGLVYPPGAYAETDELIELAKVAAAYGGFYATHLRDEGPRLIEAFKEALTIGKAAKIPVQISHHKAGGRFNWGKVKKTLVLLEEANKEHLDVSSDVYPYTAGSTLLSAMFLPLWVFEGGQEATLRRLADPHVRSRIIEDVEKRFADFWGLPRHLLRFYPVRRLFRWLLTELSRAVVLSSLPKQSHHEGKSVYQIVRERKKDLFEVLFELLLEEELAISAIAHVMSEDDVRRVLLHPTTMIGTDGFPQRKGKPHPRGFGTYPRIIEHYVQKEKLLSLEAAIHKMTGLVARKLGLKDRGVLKAGAFADLLVFEPQKV
ncbi:MAG: D-aminoacylase, partial [Sandaracinaceae bacterium]|nr:D-aminoacylase [Sandaracinaceae bacterium]